MKWLGFGGTGQLVPASGSLDWQRRAPGLTRASTRSQLLILPTLAGEGPARTARSSWYGLCRAVHHHSYELAPTAAELRGWHDDIAGLLNHL